MTYNVRHLLCATALAACWTSCLLLHAGLAVFLLVLGVLTCAIFWLVRTRSALSFAATISMIFATYIFSIPIVFVLFIVPAIDLRLEGENWRQKHWTEDVWLAYATPYAQACETRMGKKILEPYHIAWVSKGEK